MSDFVERSFPQLVELVYAAALEPARWQTFLDALSTAFDGASGVLYGFDPSRGYVDFHFNFGTDPDYVATYVDYYQHINPYGQPSINLPVGEVCMVHHGVSLEDVLKTEFYNDWMKPQGVPVDHFGMVLHKEPHKHVTFGLAPPVSAFKRNGERYAREIGLLLPHMMRALQLNRLTKSAELSERVTGIALEAIDAAAFVLNRAGRPLHLNAKAETLLRDAGVLRMSPNGAIEAVRPSDQKSLSATLARQASMQMRWSSGPLRLTSQTSGAPYVAWLVASDETGDLQAIPQENGIPSFVVLIVNPLNRAFRIPVEEIQRTFDLTVAEARLVAALAAGQDVSQYAEQVGLSRNTVRNHLASAFSKTDTNRQSELVALVIGSLRWAVR